jgi:hypothetical protein
VLVNDILVCYEPCYVVAECICTEADFLCDVSCWLTIFLCVMNRVTSSLSVSVQKPISCAMFRVG